MTVNESRLVSGELFALYRRVYISLSLDKWMTLGVASK